MQVSAHGVDEGHGEGLFLLFRFAGNKRHRDALHRPGQCGCSEGQGAVFGLRIVRARHGGAGLEAVIYCHFTLGGGHAWGEEPRYFKDEHVAFDSAQGAVDEAQPRRGVVVGDCC